MDHISERLTDDLPPGIPGLCICDEEGDYTILLNARLTREQNRQTSAHERAHIQHHDHYSLADADTIERERHSACQG